MPPPELLEEFKQYNVTLRVVCVHSFYSAGFEAVLILDVLQIDHASRDESRAKNYQIKSDAIVASSFAEVLYLVRIPTISPQNVCADTTMIRIPITSPLLI
jgi:hypothetical protein